jgi:hypothetical protein
MPLDVILSLSYFQLWPLQSTYYKCDSQALCGHCRLQQLSLAQDSVCAVPPAYYTKNTASLYLSKAAIEVQGI